MATGFRWAGIQPLIAVEWSYWTAQTYASSHHADILDFAEYQRDPSLLDAFLQPVEKPVLIYGDINHVSSELILQLLKARYGLETVDIVTGGAPCESFSMAGERKEQDTRNHLYQNIIRIAKDVNATMFLFENVKGLFSKKMDGKAGAMYQFICDEFEEKQNGKPSFRLVSRDKSEVLLKAIDYGVPQNRERLFLVGLNDAYPQLSFEYPKGNYGPDAPLPYVTVRDAITDLPRVAAGQESTRYTFDLNTLEKDSVRNQFLCRMRGALADVPAHIDFDKQTLTAHKAPGHTKKMLARFERIKQGENMKTASERLIKAGRQDEVDAYFPRKLYAARNRRLKLDEPSFTVTSHCLDEMIHPTANRGLSPREAARLQSFPDWYMFEGPYVTFHSDPDQDQYEQIGDAIPPLLAYALGEEVVKTLSNLSD